MGLWNLSMGAVAVAGCGPLVPIDGETDTNGGQTDGDPSGPHTEPWNTSTPTETDPFSCDQCPPGYVCVDYSCLPPPPDDDDDCYYGSGGYGYDCYCYDYCCDYDCYYNECYYAEDCGGGSFCYNAGFGYFECYEAEELPSCELPPTHVIPLSGGAVALAFGDAEPGGGAELLVVQPDEARLVVAGGASVTAPIALPDVDVDASAAAVAVGSGIGFAVSSEGTGGTQLVTLAGGSLVAGPVSSSPLAGIVGGDFDGDGIGDVAGRRDGNEVAWLRGTGTEFENGIDLGANTFGPLARGRWGSAGADDIATHWDYGYPYYIDQVGSGGDLFYLYYGPAVRQSLASGDFDGDGADDLVALTSNDGTMLLFPWVNTEGEPIGRWALWATDTGTDADGFYGLASGDFDGDGRDDLFIRGDGFVRIVYAGSECSIDVALPHAATAFAAGDLDGDGRSDYAFSDGMQTSVLAID